MEGFFAGFYDLKRFICDNNIFNVTSTSTVELNSNSHTLTTGYYTYTQLATELQTQIRNEDATATVVYDSITDKFTITLTAAANLTLSEPLCILTGIDRIVHTTTSIVSLNRPNIAPYSAMEIHIEGTRKQDKFILTSDSPYNGKIVYEPPSRKQIYFFGIENPQITATSRSETFKLQNIIVSLES